MGNTESSDDEPPAPDTAGERKLRGSSLRGSEQKAAVDHGEYEKTRNPDMELHIDGEEDTLYNDGLDIEEESDPLAGTRGDSSGIKP